MISQAPRHDRAVHPPTPGPAPAATALVADDDAAIRALVAAVLDSRGYRVLQAADGIEALDIARREPGPIDLLITDVAMPRLCGWSLARRVHRSRPEIALVFMSGCVDDDDLRDVVHAGGLGFLDKPFTLERLNRTVDAALARRGGV